MVKEEELIEKGIEALTFIFCLESFKTFKEIVYYSLEPLD